MLLDISTTTRNITVHVPDILLSLCEIITFVILDLHTRVPI